MEIDEAAHVIYMDHEEPIPIVFWSPMEFSVAMAFLGLFITFGELMVGLVAAAFVLMSCKYFRKGLKRGQAQHFLWSLGPAAFGDRLGNRFPNGDVQEYIE